jgi:hypothetical protein
VKNGVKAGIPRSRRDERCHRRAVTRYPPPREWVAEPTSSSSKAGVGSSGIRTGPRNADARSLLGARLGHPLHSPSAANGSVANRDLGRRRRGRRSRQAHSSLFRWRGYQVSPAHAARLPRAGPRLLDGLGCSMGL